MKYLKAETDVRKRRFAIRLGLESMNQFCCVGAK